MRWETPNSVLPFPTVSANHTNPPCPDINMIVYLESRGRVKPFQMQNRVEKKGVGQIDGWQR